MLSLILIVLVYLFLQMTVIWIAYRVTKNASVVDVSWSLGLMICGLIYLWTPPLPPRRVMIGSALIAWALRLAGYLWYTRMSQGHLDKRYTQLSEQWKITLSLGFFLNFQLQGLLIAAISLMFFWSREASMVSITGIDMLALALVITGIIGESMSDWQLQRFKKNRKGGVCNVGLWFYSRHPNYFFDWLTWVGFTVFCIQSPYGYFSIISLAVLYAIFTRVTGPLTERGSVTSRGHAYVDYQNHTPFFFPSFKKR